MDSPRVVMVMVAAVGLVVTSRLFSWWYHVTPGARELVGDVPAPEVLTEHSKEFDKPEIIQVTSDIFMAVGFALANSIMLLAPEGAIIVDTTESNEAAQRILGAFRNVSDAPIRGIIYTHHHPDHIHGAGVFAEGAPPGLQVWAHESFLDSFHLKSLLGPTIYRRGMRQFGPLLPAGHINSGIGYRLDYTAESTTSVVPPTHTFSGDQTTITIAGLELTLIHIPGETPDQIGVWIAAQRAMLCADDVYRAFPNLYAIRGTPARDVRVWAASVGRMRALRPVHLIPSHTRPVSGEEEVYQLLTDYRDAIQFVHDQAVRWLNRGLLPEEIAQRVRLPAALRRPHLEELYGTIAWSARAVVDRYMGWFSGDVVDLDPLVPAERAARMVKLLGGEDEVVSAAEAALAAEDPQWALELATHALRVTPSHTGAQSARRSALRQLASRQTSANGRNYYLTVILEDAGLLDTGVPAGLREHRVRTMSTAMLMNNMAIRYKAELCGDVHKTIIFNLTGEGVWRMELRHGIVEMEEVEGVEGSGGGGDVTVTVPVETWRGFLAGTDSPLSSYMSGDLVVEGGITEFKSLMDCFDRET